MWTRYYAPAAKPKKHRQGIIKQQCRIRLTKEARAAITARQRAASTRYHKDLNNVWAKINDDAATIAATHHKSVRRVQGELHMGRSLALMKQNKPNEWNAFCWKKRQELKADNENDDGICGKEVLPDLVRSHHKEYGSLPAEQKASILQEFSEYKVSKAQGLRISVKSRLNDVTHTLKTVGDELSNLRSHTGVEVLLFTTRGSTDFPMHGIAFTTDGVEEFLEAGLKMDTQDFISKMEGFAVRGVQGAAQNHQQRVSTLRADVCHEIQEGLRAITDDPNAKMQWKFYWRNVIKRYRVLIEGWPEKMPFKNLSEVSSSIMDLENLLRKWRSGKIHWCELSEEEFKELDTKRDKDIEDGLVEEPSGRARRSDYGKKRSRNTALPGSTSNPRPTKKHKSRAFINDSDDADDDDAGSQTELPESPVLTNDGSEGASNDAQLVNSADSVGTNSSFIDGDNTDEDDANLQIETFKSSALVKQPAESIESVGTDRTSGTM